MAFDDKIRKSLRRGRGYKFGRAYQTRFEGPDKTKFVLKHYDTDILVVDLAKRKILGWDGWSASDRDALNKTRYILWKMGYLIDSHGRGKWTFKPINAPQGLWFWNQEGELLGRAMKPVDLSKKKTQAKKRKQVVSKAIKIWKDRIESGNLAMGAGECWGISMGIQDCKDCEYLATEECGGGVQFLMMVLKKKGYRYPQIFLGDDEGPNPRVMLQNWDLIKRALKDYYNKVL